jgi:cell division protein FtsN
MPAKKKRRRAPKRARTAKRQGTPGWMWMLFGLAIGLSVAAAIWLNDRGVPPAPPAATAQPERTASAAAPPPARRQAPSQPPPETRYDFYKMLPNSEFVVAPELSSERANPAPEIVPATPGTYLLQAGSFTSREDAERMQATLALLGMQPRIEPHTDGGQTYHRVRIGPLTDPQRLDDYRRRLRQERIDFLVMRAAD